MAFSGRWLGVSLGGVLLLGCGGAPPTPTPVVEASVAEAPGTFSSERAWKDLEALAGAGSRAPGSPGADAARAYIEEALEWAGLDVEQRITPVVLDGVEPFELTHLSVTIPGEWEDRFVLVAGYDSDHFAEFENPGVNLGASGAALLVEVARVLAKTTPVYTVQILFVEGEGRLGIGSPETAELRNLGSRLLARQMKDAGEVEGIRLLIAYKGVCDVDLVIARDLLSHRHHREEFWRVARTLGFGAVFERDSIFQSVEASHEAFLDESNKGAVEELAREFEPSAGAIRNWVRQADLDDGRRSDGLTTDEREELRRLKREVRQLRTEREILKKAAAWFARESNSIPDRDSSS